jgi:choline kinase
MRFRSSAVAYYTSAAVSFPDDNTISPLIIGKSKELDQKDYLDLDKPHRHFPASVSKKRLSGRPSYEREGSSKSGAVEGNPPLPSLLSESSIDAASHSQQAHDNLLKQVGTWLKQERSRRHARKAKRKAAKTGVIDQEPPKGTATETPEKSIAHHRSDSESSHGEDALTQLAQILEKNLALKLAEAKRRPHHVHRASIGLKRHSAISLDSDYFESVDQLVPSCEATLDNSKTMAYNVDEPGAEPSLDVADKEREAWSKFRAEILRLTHTLKLKGWRKVPSELSNEINVQRLSGALTNAVYVVSPPKNLPLPEQNEDGTPKPRNPPP